VPVYQEGKVGKSVGDTQGESRTLRKLGKEANFASGEAPLKHWQRG